MPALPAVPNVARVEIQFNDEGDALIQSRLYWRYSGGPPSGADATSLANQIYAGAAAEFAPLLETTKTLIGVRFTDLSSASGADATHAANTPGTRSGNRLPASTCTLAVHIIGRRYRGGKPRTYWPFGTDSDLATAQAWTTGFSSALGGAWLGFFTAMNGYTAGSTALTAEVAVSYYHGFTVVTNPITGRAKNVSTLRAAPVVDTVTTTLWPTKLASQRRRIVR